MSAIIFTMPGCTYCNSLKQKLDAASIPYTETTADPGCGFTATPGTKLSKGGCYGYNNGYNWEAQYTVIANDYSKAAPAEPINPVTPTKTTTRPTIWADDELSIRWGAVAASIPELEYGNEDLTSTEPVPPEMPVGLTVALRDRKKHNR